MIAAQYENASGLEAFTDHAEALLDQDKLELWPVAAVLHNKNEDLLIAYLDALEKAGLHNTKEGQEILLNGGTLIFLAVKRNQPKVLKKLGEMGVDINPFCHYYRLSGRARPSDRLLDFAKRNKLPQIVETIETWSGNRPTPLKLVWP
jgi:hypothetical protein